MASRLSRIEYTSVSISLFTQHTLLLNRSASWFSCLGTLCSNKTIVLSLHTDYTDTKRIPSETYTRGSIVKNARVPFNCTSRSAFNMATFSFRKIMSSNAILFKSTGIFQLALYNKQSYIVSSTQRTTGPIGTCIEIIYQIMVAKNLTVTLISPSPNLGMIDFKSLSCYSILFL